MAKPYDYTVRDDAKKVLQQLETYDDVEVSEVAKRLLELTEDIRANKSPQIIKEGRELTRKLGKAAGRDLVKKKNTKRAAYKTSIFKCDGDYEECLKRKIEINPPNICLLYLIFCIGSHIIPFVKAAK
jgi:hypothetical protein